MPSSTAIWGRPFPVASDPPSVHTDLAALANSLETVPLYPTTAVSSRTGVAGESVAVSPSQTLTLPASPVKGDRIQIIALGTVTGATPVTVAGGGKTINGLGLSAASSFLLGTPNAQAKVQYDGTAWRVIDGQQDTGWVAITLGSGFTGTAAYARLRGDTVSLKGGITNGTGAAVTAGTTLGTMPAFAAPAAASPLLPASTSSGFMSSFLLVTGTTLTWNWSVNWSSAASTFPLTGAGYAIS